MVDKDSIRKLNACLRRGDHAEISRRSGISIASVNRFLNGKDNVVSEENGGIIIETAAILLKDRSKRNAAAEKKIELITKLA
ncbi:MAG: hypothetical protein AB2L20_15050 [Mangrovibacterium sp.]